MSGFYKCWLNFNGKLLERLAGMQCQKHTYWPRMIFLFYRAMRVWILGVLETAAIHHYLKQLTLSGGVSWDAALSPWSCLLILRSYSICAVSGLHTSPFEPANLTWSKVDLTAILAFAWFFNCITCGSWFIKPISPLYYCVYHIAWHCSFWKAKEKAYLENTLLKH